MKINPVRNFSGTLRSPREFSQTMTCVAKQRDIISNGIKLIILDFHGVMLSGSMVELSQWIARRHRVSFTEVHKIVYHKYFNMAAEGKISEYDFFRRIAKIFNEPENWKKFRAQHLNAQKLNKKVFRLALKLQKRGYKILLLSKNTRPQMREYLQRFQFRKYFRNIINTVDLNLPKASEKTMRYIMKKYKISNPKEILYTDDQKDNLVAPKKMGVKVVLYKNFAKFKESIKKYL